MKKWLKSLSTAQKMWIILSTISVGILGALSKDTPINILIGIVGMFYVAVYSTGTRWSFILGIVYVGLYTVICLENRIMLDALQNIVLIPLYLYSFFYWGKKKIKPRNMSPINAGFILVTAVMVCGLLFGLSKLLNGNYSGLDALNTTCTLYAMVLGMYGYSLNWCLWTVNNITSALTFGLALATPTGSITVFAMKVIFMVNGIIGWANFRKIAKESTI